MTNPASAPVFEAGYVNGAVLPTPWQEWDSSERVPELRWPARNQVFSRMGCEDGRVASLLQAIWLPIVRTQWRVAPNGARDEVTEFVARNLGLPIVGADEGLPKERSRGRFSWAQHLRWALLALQYGHSVFEQVYRIEGSGAGMRAHLRKLAPRPQKTIVKFNVARDGGLESIVQAVPAGSSITAANVLDGGISIPVDRLVAYVHDQEPGDWTGRSILRPAYKHWILKDELMRIQAIAAKRNGVGVPVVTAQDLASDDDLAKYQAMASAWQSSAANAGAALPYGASAALMGVNGNLFDMNPAIEYHDKQIALAGLAHFLNLGDRGGSYALASVQSDTFVQAEQSHAETVRDTAQDHVVEDLVDINFGEDEPCPRLVFDEIGSRQDLTAQALKLLIDAGLIRLDRSLEEYTRQQYGLPPKDTPAPAEPWTPPEQATPAPADGSAV